MIDINNLPDIAKRVNGQIVGGCVIADVGGKMEYIVHRNGTAAYVTDVGMQVLSNLDRMDQVRAVVAELEAAPAATGEQQNAGEQKPAAEDDATAKALEAALAGTNPQ